MLIIIKLFVYYICISVYRYNNSAKQKYFGADAYECKQCGRTYRRKKNVMCHMKYECNKDPQFVCKICGKAIYYRSNFKRHMMVNHQIF